jgi:hypothetical protein
LSEEVAIEWLDAGELKDRSKIPLSEYDKKDDIADSINMLRAHLIQGELQSPLE